MVAATLGQELRCLAESPNLNQTNESASSSTRSLLLALSQAGPKMTNDVGLLRMAAPNPQSGHKRCWERT